MCIVAAKNKLKNYKMREYLVNARIGSCDVINVSLKI